LQGHIFWWEHLWRWWIFISLCCWQAEISSINKTSEILATFCEECTERSWFPTLSISAGFLATNAKSLPWSWTKNRKRKSSEFWPKHLEKLKTGQEKSRQTKSKCHS
jgi:hypothetical protein